MQVQQKFQLSWVMLIINCLTFDTITWFLYDQESYKLALQCKLKMTANHNDEIFSVVYCIKQPDKYRHE